MHPYQVGELYHPNRTQWPETSEYNYRSGKHELLLLIRDLAENEIGDIQRGPAEFGLLVEGRIIFFLYQFRKSIPWSEATCSWHLVSKNERIVPDPKTDLLQALLTVILVDASTGIVKALRTLTLSTEFTRSLHQALRDLAARPWPGNTAYEVELRAAYRKYRNAALMVELAVLTKGRD